MTTKNSHKEHGDVKWVYLACDRRGTPSNKATIRPRTASAKYECKMQVLITHCDEDDEFFDQQGSWKVTCNTPEHNHEPSDDPAAHASHRRFTQATRDQIRTSYKAETAARTLYSHLTLGNGEISLKPRDIYNEFARIRAEDLAGKTPTEALFDLLQGTEENPSKWQCGARINTKTRRVLQLFFAYKPAINLMHAYPDVLMADCTYKTNMFSMPLLHFLGASPLGHFSTGFCFMPDETYSSYKWACDAFDKVVLGGSGWWRHLQYYLPTTRMHSKMLWRIRGPKYRSYYACGT